MAEENDKTLKRTYHYLAKTIGGIFKAQREKRRITLRNIYKNEKISIAVVSDFEDGNKFPRMETLLKLFDYINIPIDIIFNSKLFEVPEEFQKINYTNATNNRKRMFQSLDKDTYLREALKVKGLAGNDIENVLLYIEFLLSKKDLTSKETK